MRSRFSRLNTGLAVLAAVFALAAEPSFAQSVSKSKTWTQLKTPWGDPDLQGTWTSDDCIGTPMNRPAQFGDRLFYTEQELADRQRQIEKQSQNDVTETVAADARVGTGPPAHWGERARRPCRQTSLVVDPPNGQTPDFLALVPDGRGDSEIRNHNRRPGDMDETMESDDSLEALFPSTS